jgi:hypothetical protein
MVDVLSIVIACIYISWALCFRPNVDIPLKSETSFRCAVNISMLATSVLQGPSVNSTAKTAPVIPTLTAEEEGIRMLVTNQA